MALKRRQLFQPLLLAACLLVLTVPLQQHQLRVRPELRGREFLSASGVQGLAGGPTAALIASLGGFRYLAADLLWLESDKVWHSGDWWAMVPLLQGVVSLDPHFILVWQTLGWHHAWNLNVAETSAIGKARQIEEGVRVFKAGIEANPTIWDLRWELAWLYYDRTKDYKAAAPAIREAARTKDAPSYISRFGYRVYEKTLEIPKLKAALEENLKLFPKDPLHQQKVRQDYDYWFRGWKKQEIRNGKPVFVQMPPAAYDPSEHKRNITKTNVTRKNRGLPPYLYPGNPYWDVDPKTGMAIPKGSLKAASSQTQPRASGS